MAECIANKPNGDRCGAQAMRDSLLCYAHNPDVAEERQRSRVKGGKSGGRGRPKGGAELASVKAQLRQLAEDVLEGRVDARDGAVVSQIFNTFIRAVEVERRVKELEEVEERLDELEHRPTQEISSVGTRTY